MTINQLSIFIENRSGTLVKVLDILKQSGIQIIASTIADTAEYGIYRLICSEPSRAYQELKNAGVAVALSDVFALKLDNEPGKAADAVRIISDADISITYMYTFLWGGKGILIFRTDQTEKAHEVILQNQLNFINEYDLAGRGEN
ncbi:MAG: amino acid-binding protein [Bacteroidaceae bacterium]|nr:amino acid-binding protein [Bacteroidaceae bacterium]